MKTLDRMMEALEEEVDGARDYAEKYIDCKARGNIQRANKYKEMAQDELKHFSMLREMSVADAEGIKKVHTLTEEEEHKWEHSHKKLNDEIAMIQHLLSM